MREVCKVPKVSRQISKVLPIFIKNKLNIFKNFPSKKIIIYILQTYGASAAGRDFCSTIVTKNFKPTLLCELIFGSYGNLKSSCGWNFVVFWVVGATNWHKTPKNVLFWPILTLYLSKNRKITQLPIFFTVLKWWISSYIFEDLIILKG